MYKMILVGECKKTTNTLRYSLFFERGGFLFFFPESSRFFLLGFHHLFEVGFLHAAVVVADVFVNEDASAIFANNDFFAGADVQLALWRDFVKASAASVPVNSHDCQSVSGIGTDFTVCGE